MRTKFSLIVFIISTFAFSANSNDSITQNKIENLQKENESLKKEIEIIKIKSESTSVMIDNVDSMYQNNFDRMIFLFGSLGAIIVFASPVAVFFYNRWLKNQQKELIELKEKELNASNEERISKIESDLEQKFADSKNEYYKKLEEEKKNLEEKLNVSNEEKIKGVIKHLEERFTESEYNFYNKLDEHKKILEDDINEKTQKLEQNIIEKTQKLEQNITDTEYSLTSKIAFFISIYNKDNNDYENYIKFKLIYFKNSYISNDCQLIEIINMLKELIEEIKDMSFSIDTFKFTEFFEEELKTTNLEISEDDKKVFEKFKNTLKEKED